MYCMCIYVYIYLDIYLYMCVDAYISTHACEHTSDVFSMETPKAHKRFKAPLHGAHCVARPPHGCARGLSPPYTSRQPPRPGLRSAAGRPDGAGGAGQGGPPVHPPVPRPGGRRPAAADRSTLPGIWAVAGHGRFCCGLSRTIVLSNPYACFGLRKYVMKTNPSF